MTHIAILLTCYNRAVKTDVCLRSLMQGLSVNNECSYHIYLVDDNSTDGTAALIKNKYPNVNIIQGTGFLFWAGGMRLAWETALNSKEEYDGFLLINDDVEFIDSFWDKIHFTRQWCKTHFNKEGIYVLSVKDREKEEISYGGHLFRKRLFKHSTVLIKPTEQPQLCELANSNILYVSSEVVKNIGLFDAHFTHFIADFDYTLCASKKGIPVVICPDFGGYCTNDHTNYWLTLNTLHKRINYLYSVKGMALNEYLYYLRKHFWWKALYLFVVLWIETLFPFLKRNT